MPSILRLYHVSEEPGIKLFKPRPSTQSFDNITGNVVFAVTEKLLHNYLLPRDCPRVTYFAKSGSTQTDIDRFIGETKAQYIINTEESWRNRIKNIILYLYELPPEPFTMLDEGAGYYISYEEVTPLSVTVVRNAVTEIERRGAEIRFLPEIKTLAGEISKSSLQFSIIRLRNAV